MSMPTLTSTGDGFDDLEFALIVADFDRPDDGTDSPRVFRPTRAAERRDAQQQIDAALGFGRHRTHEREA